MQIRSVLYTIQIHSKQNRNRHNLTKFCHPLFTCTCSCILATIRYTICTHECFQPVLLLWISVCTSYYLMRKFVSRKETWANFIYPNAILPMCQCFGFYIPRHTFIWLVGIKLGQSTSRVQGVSTWKLGQNG